MHSTNNEDQQASALLASQRVLDTFVSVADTLVGDFDLIEFLHTLTEQVLPISGAEAAGILLADADGNLEFMAASSDEARVLEVFQAQREQGPCHDAYRTRKPVINGDLGAATDRWPAFAPKAVSLGFGSVHALPLRVREQSLGALNLFSPKATDLDEAGVRIVQALADIATISILQERRIHRAEAVTEQLQGALNSRIVIEQAKGAVAQALDLDMNGAFQALRAYSRDHGYRLTMVCEQVISSPAALRSFIELRCQRL